MRTAPVRAGVPVVFPWFGDHDASKPAHGFARGREWTVVATSASSVTLAVRDDEQTRALWPHEFSAELEVTLRDTLQVACGSTTRRLRPSRSSKRCTPTSRSATSRQPRCMASRTPLHRTRPRARSTWDAARCASAQRPTAFQGVPAEITLQAPALGRAITLTAPGALGGRVEPMAGQDRDAHRWRQTIGRRSAASRPPTAKRTVTSRRASATSWRHAPR